MFSKSYYRDFSRNIVTLTCFFTL